MEDATRTTALAGALEALGREEYRLGAAWRAAHELAQAHEGEPEFDRLHALLHRIEGDDANAAYWYRRAGRPVCEGTFRDEARAMLDELPA